ncbi:hypothetical protein, partial [Streptomyces sp. NPDC004976]
GLVGTHPQEVAEYVELALPRTPENGPQQGVAGAEVINRHTGRGAGGSGQRLEPVREAVRKGVISAGFEQPLLDMRLRSSAHYPTFSRNGGYVYR